MGIIQSSSNRGNNEGEKTPRSIFFIYKALRLVWRKVFSVFGHAKPLLPLHNPPSSITTEPLLVAKTPHICPPTVKEEDDDVSVVVEIKRTISVVLEERWIKHYSSGHRILLVGEGNFSFSACLAQEFRSAPNIIATSLDSLGEVSLHFTFHSLVLLINSCNCNNIFLFISISEEAL